ncbi:MAG TPA: hypothetical protein VFB16_04905 [Bauldia sp.]|nr:hypothetical protein [Bauldia sp.]
MQQLRAYFLRAFDVMTNPQQPGLAVIAFKTDNGDSFFGVNRDALEKLAALAAKVAGQLQDDQANQGSVN